MTPLIHSEGVKGQHVDILTGLQRGYCFLCGCFKGWMM